MGRFKYDVINTQTKKQESWTGVFKSGKKADEWYEKYGKKWEEKGKELVRVECAK